MWQYRAYVMDSVSSDQAIITSHRHSSMHTYTIFMHHAYIVSHTIPCQYMTFLNIHTTVQSFYPSRCKYQTLLPCQSSQKALEKSVPDHNMHVT